MIRRTLMTLALVASVAGFGQTARAEVSSLLIGIQPEFTQTPLSLPATPRAATMSYGAYAGVQVSVVNVDRDIYVMDRTGQRQRASDVGGESAGGGVHAGAYAIWRDALYIGVEANFNYYGLGSDTSKLLMNRGGRNNFDIDWTAGVFADVGLTDASLGRLAFCGVGAMVFDTNQGMLLGPAVRCGVSVGFGGERPVRVGVVATYARPGGGSDLETEMWEVAIRVSVPLYRQR
jgi:hypothetical protein